MDIKDRVLVIEDDKSIRNFFRTVLEANNYDVLIATTGAEGYSMVTSQCPDVVILDLGLPDMDGMTIPAQTVQKNAKVTSPGTLTRTGYVFGGWYKNLSGGSTGCRCR